MVNLNPSHQRHWRLYSREAVSRLGVTERVGILKRGPPACCQQNWLRATWRSASVLVVEEVQIPSWNRMSWY